MMWGKLAGCQLEFVGSDMRFSRGVTWLAFAGVMAGGLIAVGSAGAQTANPKAVEAQAKNNKPERNAAGNTPVQQVSNRADRGAGVVSEGDIYDSVLNEDGTRTIRLGVAPKSVSDGKTGKRTKISTDLIPSGDGFAAELAEPVRIGGSTDSADLVSVGKPGRQLRLGKPNSSGIDQDKTNTAVASRGVRAGEGKATPSRSSRAKRSNKPNEVDFDQAFGVGTKLTYEILPDAVKESIVLSGPPAGPDAPVFRFPVSADGMKPRTTNDGSIEFVDEGAKVVFTIPPAFAFDSRSGANTPGNAYVNVKMDLVSEEAGYTIVVAPSMDWLRDGARVYPVTIDPTVQLQPWNPMNLGYMPWGNNSGGNSFSAWTNELIFGNWWGSQWRSYIQFDPALFAGKTITNATLNMRVQSCDNQTNPAAPYANSIGVHKLTSAYYFGQTWPGASWNGEVWASPTGPNSNSTANITAFAAEWAANSQTNLGLMLDMGTAQGYCRVQRTAPTGQQTFIEVTYNEAPSTVQEYGYLKNFSFENGQSSFQACSRAEAATWSVVTGSTPSGLKHAKLRANNAGDVSICQALITPVGPTKQYNLIASVRSSTGVPISGKVSLLENGPSPANAKTDFTTVGTAWQNVSVSMNGVNALNWGLQTDVFVGSPYTADLDIDYVVLSVSNVPGTPPPPVYPPTTTPPPPPATAPPTTVPPAPPGVPYRLNRDQYLLDGGYLISPNGRYRATVTSGNLVVMDMQAPTSVKWSSSSSGNWGSGLLMQGDGNLVMYSTANPPTNAIWASWTNGTGAGNYLVMQDDANLVVYRADGVAVWSWLTGRLQLPNPPAPSGPVIPIVVVITDGTTVIVTTPPPPAGAHLFDGTPTILELSDTVNLDCLVLSGTTAVLTTDKTQCLLVTPFLVPYGYLLGIGDLENINDAGSCLVPSGSSLVSSTCVANQGSVVTDIPGIDGLRFPIRRFSPDYLGACLTRSGTLLVFASCPAVPASDQLWYDKNTANDWAGRALLFHWLYGQGKELNINQDSSHKPDWFTRNVGDGDWSSYLQEGVRNHSYSGQVQIKNYLLDKTAPMFQTWIGQGQVGTGMSNSARFNFSFTNGESIIGYNYLHGSNSTVGDTYLTFGKVVFVDQGTNFQKITIDSDMVFNDITDPNAGYSTDTAKVRYAKKACRIGMILLGPAGACNPTNFITRLRWTQRFQVTKDLSSGVVNVAYL